jgi:predicted amidohydrolase YtcJ
MAVDPVAFAPGSEDLAHELSTNDELALDRMGRVAFPLLADCHFHLDTALEHDPKTRAVASENHSTHSPEAVSDRRHRPCGPLRRDVMKRFVSRLRWLSRSLLL